MNSSKSIATQNIGIFVQIFDSYRYEILKLLECVHDDKFCILHSAVSVAQLVESRTFLLILLLRLVEEWFEPRPGQNIFFV